MSDGKSVPMGDAKLNPRQLADLLQRLDEIDKQGKGIRQQLINAMAQRRDSERQSRKASARRLKR
jgi:hypothetical protein